jgi:hypothetical protein
MRSLKDMVSIGQFSSIDSSVEPRPALQLDPHTIQACIDETKKLRACYNTHRDIEPKENDYYIDAFLSVEVRLKEVLTKALKELNKT